MSNGNFPLNFDASQVDPRQSEGGVCFPLGDYPFEIVGIDQVAAKDNPNKGFLAIKLKCLAGEMNNQIQIDRLNLYGQAETPTRIAYQRLSAYCHVAGKLRIGNASELLGARLIATVGPQNPPDEKYSEVKLVKDFAGNVPVFGTPCAPQQPGQIPQVQGGMTQQPQQGFSAPQGQQQPQQTWNNPGMTQQPAQQPTVQSGVPFGGQQTQQPQGGGQPWGGGQQQPANNGGGNTPPWAK